MRDGQRSVGREGFPLAWAGLLGAWPASGGLQHFEATSSSVCCSGYIGWKRLWPGATWAEGSDMREWLRGFPEQLHGLTAFIKYLLLLAFHRSTMFYQD